jgi:hypothetical protein
MTSDPLSVRRPQRSSTFPSLLLASAAAALLAVTLTATTPAALAAPLTPLAGAAFEGGDAGAGTATLAGSVTAPPRPLLKVVPVESHDTAAWRLLPPGRLTSVPAQPRDVSTGLFLVGAVGATWSTTEGADITAANIENLRASGTTGTLSLSLWATSSVPVTSEGIQGFEIAVGPDLGTLAAGGAFTDVDTNEIDYSPPDTEGCYYVSVVLLENGLVADVRPFTKGGGTLSAPQTNGYIVFPFHGGSGTACPAATSCTRTATSGCLLSSRFQVSVAYDNSTSGIGSGTVLSFNGTRAESDESIFYYFTDPSNFEIGAKILDACALTNTFWIFIGGLTNQGWGLDVLDTQTGNHHYYLNIDGTTTVTTTDTAALPCP